MNSAVTWSVGQHHHHVMHIIFLLFCFRPYKVEEEAARERSENEIYSFVPTDKHRNVIYWRWSSINNRFIKMLGEEKSQQNCFLPVRLALYRSSGSIDFPPLVVNNNGWRKKASIWHITIKSFPVAVDFLCGLCDKQLLKPKDRKRQCIMASWQLGGPPAVAYAVAIVIHRYFIS